MDDIFLSYARVDLAKAEMLAAALEKQGWSVFWDISSIFVGDDFDVVIEKAIAAAKCMIVLWSEASRKSDYVRDEARKGRKRNILAPILIELTGPPLGFGSLHTENFAAWSGDIQSNEFNKLQCAVTRLAGSGTARDVTSTAEINKTPFASTPKPPTSGSMASIISNNSFIEPDMVFIPAGRFQMGSDESSYENPIHAVNLAKPFSIAKYLVTFDEYKLFVKANNRKLPSDEGWGRGKRPVIDVSWEDTTAYARWLSAVSGKIYRLPSDAEWEYAARAGSESVYYWGDSEKDADSFAWFNSNSEGKTHPVGEKRPNAFGLYDMAGNVWEWVEDCWHDDYHYRNAPADGSSWQARNNGECARRVLRGGAWSDRPDDLRSAYRGWIFLDFRYNFIGFRLAQD